MDTSKDRRTSVEWDIEYNSRRTSTSLATRETESDRRKSLTTDAEERRKSLARGVVIGGTTELRELLEDRNGAVTQAFAAYLRQELSHENIEFWWACEDYKNRGDHGSLLAKVALTCLCDEFVREGAPKQVNLDNKVRLATLEATHSNPGPDALLQAQSAAFTLMLKDTYPRFIKSFSSLPGSPAPASPEQQTSNRWSNNPIYGENPFSLAAGNNDNSDAYLVLFNDDSEKDYFVRFSIRPNIFSVVPKTKTQIMFKIPKGIRGNLLLFMKVPSDGERDLWMSALQRVCPSPSSQSLFPSPSAGNELSPERSANRSPKHTRSRSVSSAPVPSPKVAGVPAMLTPPSTATNIRRSMSNLSAVLDHPENDGSLFCAESHSKCVQAAEQLQNAVKDSKDAQLQRLVGSLIEALALYSSDVNIESQRLKDEIRGLKEASGTLNQTVVEMGQQMHRLEKLGFRMSRYGSKERPGARGDESPEESDNDDEFFDAVDAQISSRRTSLKSLARAPTVNLIEQMAKEPPTFRTELPADKSDRKLSVWKFLKDNIGKDFSKISMPIVLNEPISAVQRVCEDLEPAFLLTQAASCQDPDERLLYIAIFSIAAYKNTSRTGKPFNPLLGETFELDLSNVKGYEYRAVAEQVSHHPPVTAVHAQGKGWRWWKQVDIKNKFRGKSMEVYPTGTIHVLIGDEHYTWDCVTSVVNNLVVGTLWVDQGVVCDASGKEVYQIEANCHDFARARRTDSPNGNFVEYWVKQPLPPKSAQQFNFSRFTMLLNEMRDEYKGVIAPTDSRYRPDLHLYEEGNLDQAQDEKTRLEEKQRAVRRAREARGEEWTPLWFEEQKDKDLGTVCWMLSLSESRDYWAHRKSKDWKGSPDLY